jgi:hypothetical protein
MSTKNRDSLATGNVLSGLPTRQVRIGGELHDSSHRVRR